MYNFVAYSVAGLACLEFYISELNIIFTKQIDTFTFIFIEKVKSQ